MRSIVATRSFNSMGCCDTGWRRAKASSCLVSCVARSPASCTSARSACTSWSGGRHSRATDALLRIAVSRLLKSCAMPPASRPTVSRRCDCCSCCSSFRRSVTSRATITPPTISSASRMGRALTSKYSAAPSVVSKAASKTWSRPCSNASIRPGHSPSAASGMASITSMPGAGGTPPCLLTNDSKAGFQATSRASALNTDTRSGTAASADTRLAPDARARRSASTCPSAARRVLTCSSSTSAMAVPMPSAAMSTMSTSISNCSTSAVMARLPPSCDAATSIMLKRCTPMATMMRHIQRAPRAGASRWARRIRTAATTAAMLPSADMTPTRTSNRVATAVVDRSVGTANAGSSARIAAPPMIQVHALRPAPV